MSEKKPTEAKKSKKFILCSRTKIAGEIYPAGSSINVKDADQKEWLKKGIIKEINSQTKTIEY